MVILKLEFNGKTFRNVPVDGLKELGLSSDQITALTIKQNKENALESIIEKASKVRTVVTKKTDLIKLLGYANKADIGRAVLSGTATEADISVITNELEKRIAKKRSPKSHTIELLAAEQVKRQCELVALANFVEDFEDDAIDTINALTDVESIETTLAALNIAANEALAVILEPSV